MMSFRVQFLIIFVAGIVSIAIAFQFCSLPTLRKGYVVCFQEELVPTNEKSGKKDNVISIETAEIKKRRGRPHTEESKAKIGQSNKGRTAWNKGKKLSTEAKYNIALGSRKNALTKKKTRATEFGMSLEEYDNFLVSKRKKHTKRPNVSEETKAKISAALREKWQDPKYRKNRLNTMPTREGVPHTEETRARISAKVKDLWQDPDYRSKSVGKEVSIETREKLSKKLKEKWKDPEFRAQSLSGARATRTPAHNENIREAIRAKWADPAYREKATEAMKEKAKKAVESRKTNRETRPKMMKKRPVSDRKNDAEKNRSIEPVAFKKRNISNELMKSSKTIVFDDDFMLEMNESGALKDEIDSQNSDLDFENSDDESDSDSEVNPQKEIKLREQIVQNEFIISKQKSGRVQIRMY